MRQKVRKYIVPLVLIILMPHLVNLATCTMMIDKQLREIPMAVYLGDNTDLTREIVRSFDENETFDVQYYVESIKEIETLMSEGKVQFGLAIPVNFTKDVKGAKAPTVDLVIDGSQLSLASFTKIRSSEILLTIKTGAMMSLYQGKFNISEHEALNTAMPISITTRLLGNPTRNYINFLLPGMMTALVQVGLAMNASAVFSRRERETFKQSFVRYLLNFSTLGFVSMLGIVAVQSVFFKTPIKGSLLQIILLTALFNLAVTAVSLAIASGLNNKVFASQVGALWFIPSSILSGYTWPLISMPDGIQRISHLMPFTYYGDTLRDLMLKGNSYVYGENLIKLMIIFAVASVAAFVLNTIRIRSGGGQHAEIND